MCWRMHQECVDAGQRHQRDDQAAEGRRMPALTLAAANTYDKKFVKAPSLLAAAHC